MDRDVTMSFDSPDACSNAELQNTKGSRAPVATCRKYTELGARDELEQQVAKDLEAALEKRGALVKHHGTPASHAPSTAPADITIDWGEGGRATRLLVEVAQRNDESEFTSITEHLNRAVATSGKRHVHVLYAGRSTSVRLAKFIRNENQRRSALNEKGRIIFVRLNDFQEILAHWASFPQSVYPLSGFVDAVERWREFTSDVSAYRILQSALFPDWTDKATELASEAQRGVAYRQERLRKDIIRLENKLRESGITGNSAHKILIFLFFMALFEDKRGVASRMTKEGFISYRDNLSAKDKREFADRTAHHLMMHQIAEDEDIRRSGLMSHYESIQLSDSFVLSEVLPIFESYPLSEGDMDFIGAVFEALARRAEKDNRIGQFFTPETAVLATCRLAAPKPTDFVLDPACGTGRFLIHAMSIMLSQAGTLSGRRKEDLETDIKEHHLLGADIDPWVATIAKMNMYLHGDGKSNIKAVNGLALSTGTPFAPREPAYVRGSVGVVLTNPPLGDVNFRDAAQKLAIAGLLGELRATVGTKEYDNEVSQLANAWSNKCLSVVPHTCVEEQKQQEYQKTVAKWEQKTREAIINGDDKAEKKALRHKAAAVEKLANVNRSIGAGRLTYEPSGNTAKGGALFLSAILDYLCPVRLPGNPEEWKGGVVGIVIDEAVLNTSAYESARKFIVTNFFLKAVISLPRDAFQFLARTTAKTSILLLTKKPDRSVIQREPIFYAKAQVIGYTSSGVTERNDLDAINASFDIWRERLLACYDGELLNHERVRLLVEETRTTASQCFPYELEPSEPGARLDFAYRRMLDIQGRLTEPTRLCDLLEPVVRIPEERDVHEYAYVSSTDGRVRSKGVQDLAYSERDLRVLRSGDILLSGIDVVKGAIGVVGEDCNGLVVSKEFFTLIPRKDATVEVLPEYVVCLLRSPLMREIIEGTVTGVSNRTRIDDIQSFLELPIPKPASREEQVEVAERLKAAYMAQDRAQTALEEIEAAVSKAPAV